jgi:8-oxo-dGTP pyrophosphatase MutT (NUDIX family)
VGETRFDALQRELREEIGLEIDALGQEVWTKTSQFQMGDRDGQVDHIHLVWPQQLDPQPALSASEFAAVNMHEIRWWSVEDLHGCSTFASRDFPALLDRLRAEGIPTTPIEIEGC